MDFPKRRRGRNVSLIVLAGVVLIIEQSVAFVVSPTWMLSWWGAHLLGGTATVMLTWWVLIAVSDAERRATQLAQQVRIA